VTRDDLEAAIWKRWPTRDPIADEAVEAILTCVDAHVSYMIRTTQVHVPAPKIRVAAEDTPTRQTITAARRAVLEDALTRKRATSIIWSCPTCDRDLDDDSDPGTMWCPTCQTTVPYAQLAGVTDADLD